MMNTIRRLSLPALAVAIGALLSCNSRTLNQTAKAVGEEAAYATLRAALVKGGVVSADRMVDAVRLVVDHKDYGGAAGAFAIALNEHNSRSSQKLTSTQAIALMRLAEPAVRAASPRVGAGLQGFCDYVSSHG
jgi:hypothetical protein